jgi:hypothetical protein
MKYNAGTTTMDRLKIVIGILLVAIGLFILFVVNSIFAYSNTFLWILGFGFIAVGGYMAKSIELYLFIIDAVQTFGGSTTPNGGRPIPTNKKNK